MKVSLWGGLVALRGAPNRDQKLFLVADYLCDKHAAESTRHAAAGRYRYYAEIHPAPARVYRVAAGLKISPNLVGRLTADFALCSQVSRLILSSWVKAFWRWVMRTTRTRLGTLGCLRRDSWKESLFGEGAMMGFTS